MTDGRNKWLPLPVTYDNEQKYIFMDCDEPVQFEIFIQ